MFYVLFCALTLTFVSARVKDKEIFHLSPESILRMQKFSTPCLEETNASPDILEKLVVGTIEKDAASRDWLDCFTQRGGYVDEKGHFVIDKMAVFFQNHPLVKSLMKTLVECNEITMEDRIETIYAMEQCLHDKAPVIFSL